jgi:hypothetical protein
MKQSNKDMKRQLEDVETDLAMNVFDPEKDSRLNENDFRRTQRSVNMFKGNSEDQMRHLRKKTNKKSKVKRCKCK